MYPNANMTSNSQIQKRSKKNYKTFFSLTDTLIKQGKKSLLLPSTQGVTCVSFFFLETTPDQSEPRSDGNKRVLCIPRSPSIIGTSPSDCLVSYPGRSLGEVLPLYREAVCVFYSPSWLSNIWLWITLNNKGWYAINTNQPYIMYIWK